MNDPGNKELLESCYNWLGYGNLNSKYWFLGIEEGDLELSMGKEISSIKLDDTNDLENLNQEQIKNKLYNKKLLKSISIRTDFRTSEDFHEVWTGKYQCDLTDILSKPSTCKFIAAFLLAFKGEQKIEAEDVRQEILDERFGSLDGYLFFGEFYPLPKIGKNKWPDLYNSLYDGVTTAKEMLKRYYDDEKFISDRRNMFINEINKNENLELIISYNRDILKLLQPDPKSTGQDFPFINNGRKRPQVFTLHDLNVGEKNLKVLITPFFGVGWISYNGIVYVVNELRKIGVISN